MTSPKKKNPVGRPKKTTNDLPPDWQNIALDLYKEGASDVEVRVALDTISDDLWYRLIQEDEEFSRTIKKGRLICQSWWERQARKNLGAGRLNTALWQINMRNRFGWKDKDTDDIHDYQDTLINISKQLEKHYTNGNK